MMKYIVFDDHQGGLHPVLFPQSEDHDKMATAVQRAKRWVPRSAGSVRFIDGSIKCGVGSLTLKLKVHPTDSMIIYKFLRDA